jgi:AmiR/NasT family two-component response regulator
VLLARLDPITRHGLVRALADDGVDVVGEEQSEEGIVRTASELSPAVIVLDGECEESDDLSRRLRAATPGSRLILMPREERECAVFEPAEGRPRRSAGHLLQTLREALFASRPTTEE